MKTSLLAKQLARELRKNQTLSERLLWDKLRNRRLAGFKFTRQHSIFYFKNNSKKFFIADFYCHQLKLVIEIDGKIHLKQQDYDKAREDILKAKSLHILRFENQHIVSNIDECLRKIVIYVELIYPSLLNQRRVRDE